jgi:CBS-domain-containing membrane protein
VDSRSGSQQDELRKVHLKDMENSKIGEILHTDPKSARAYYGFHEELLIHLTNQNYIPVIDDANSLSGIVTRREILNYFYMQSNVGEVRLHEVGKMRKASF